jgi:hypothetical protein
LIIFEDRPIEKPRRCAESAALIAIRPFGPAQNKGRLPGSSSQATDIHLACDALSIAERAPGTSNGLSKDKQPFDWQML